MPPAEITYNMSYYLMCILTYNYRILLIYEQMNQSAVNTTKDHFTVMFFNKIWNGTFLDVSGWRRRAARAGVYWSQPPHPGMTTWHWHLSASTSPLAKLKCSKFLYDTSPCCWFVSSTSVLQHQVTAEHEVVNWEIEQKSLG